MWCVGMHGKLKECAEAATVKKIMSMKGEDRGIEKEKVILKKRQLQKKKKKRGDSNKNYMLDVPYYSKHCLQKGAIN